MRILVCGGRDFRDRQLLVDTLNQIVKPNDQIIHGGAKGADALAHAYTNYWSRFHFEDAQLATPEVYPAQWNLYGKRAGPIRNQQMLDTGIDLVVAFPGGRGTYDMARRAKKAGVEVISVSPEGDLTSSLEDGMIPG